MTNEAVRETHHGLSKWQRTWVLSQMLKFLKSITNVYILFTKNCGNELQSHHIFPLCLSMCLVDLLSLTRTTESRRNAQGFKNKDTLWIVQGKMIQDKSFFTIFVKPISYNFYSKKEPLVPLPGLRHIVDIHGHIIWFP